MLGLGYWKEVRIPNFSPKEETMRKQLAMILVFLVVFFTHVSFAEVNFNSLSPEELEQLLKTLSRTNHVEGTFTANGAEIRRSIVTPLQVFTGQHLRVENPSFGKKIDLPQFFGSIMILKYRVKGKLVSKSFLERTTLVYQNYDFTKAGVPEKIEIPFSVNDEGEWSDVLLLGDNLGLPDDAVRIVKQELYWGNNLIIVNLIRFTPRDITFVPVPVETISTLIARR